MRTQQQLGKIDQPGTLAEFFIGLIDRNLLALVRITLVFNVLRALTFILARIDIPLRLAWWPAAFIQLQRLEYAPYNPVLVIGIQHLKGLRQSCVFPVSAQQTVRQTVKRPDPHTACRHPDQLFDTGPHFSGCLVGEGHRKNTVWRDALDLHQPCDPVHQHPGFTAAGTRQHQQWILRGGNGFTLRVVQ